MSKVGYLKRIKVGNHATKGKVYKVEYTSPYEFKYTRDNGKTVKIGNWSIGTYWKVVVPKNKVGGTIL